MKNKLSMVLAAALLTLTGCGTTTSNKTSNEESKPSLNSNQETSVTMKVIHETKFDSVYGEYTISQFKDAGFAFGDSVNVTFSSGFTFEDIPFYDGYYVKAGAPLIVGYQGYPHIDFATNNKANCYQNLELKDGDTMTITLNQKGKYLTEQETFSTTYSDDREKYTSDEEFANFRAMNLSTMKENIFYRGASPVDNQHNRASYVDSLIEKAGVGFILDLADSENDMKSYLNRAEYTSSYASELYNYEKIAFLSMGSDFTAPIFQQKLATGLTELIKHEGTYYIHCTEGKDRTGFVCYLLEALTGAEYDELEHDYMVTYDNYYGINKEETKDKYDAIVDLRFKDFINLLTPTHDGSYLGERASKENGVFYSTNTSLQQAAKQYLIEGGMTEEAVETLINIMKK